MKVFDILYTKDPSHKKRKVYHDGLMKIEENCRGSTSFKVILLNEDSKVLIQVGEQDVSKYSCDTEVKVGNFLVQIEKENILSSSSQPLSIQVLNKSVDNAITRNIAEIRPTLLPISKQRIPFKPQSLLSKHSSTSVPSNNKKPEMNSTPSSVIDPQLLRVMHPHQVVAVEFLLNCLNSPFPEDVPNTSSTMSACTNIAASLCTSARESANTVANVDHELDYIFDDEKDAEIYSEDECEVEVDEEGSEDDVDEWFLTSAAVTRLQQDQVQQQKLEQQQQPQQKKRKCSAFKPASAGATVHDFKACRGAVLADEMGLGKSLVSIAVLWHFVNHGKAKGVIVCPSSLVDNWHRELKKWLGVRLNAIRVRPGAQAAADVQTFIVGHRTMSPVMIISYELFRKHAESINRVPRLEVIICDEGHRLKNVAGTQTSRALSACVARKRVVLTGSPIQNNLDELFAILQFVAPDNELGTLPNFKNRMTRHKLSLPGEDPLLSKVLRSLVMRRTQDEVLKHLLPPRREVLLCVDLSSTQLAQYVAESARVMDSIHSSCGAVDTILPGLQRLRQICNVAIEDEAHVAPTGGPHHSQKEKMSGGPAEEVLMSSAKLQVLDEMLQLINNERISSSNGGKVVIVSNFTSMLDHVSNLLSSHGWGKKMLRLDGSVACDLRQGLVDRFNRPSDPCWIFLLAAKAGGVGLNLIGANRLVMLDCDWNPSIDLQAMARVWREGQRLPVTIFRFVTLGKIEQSIMERQLKKGALCSVLDCLNPPSGSQSDRNIHIGREDEEDSVGWDEVLESANGDAEAEGVLETGRSDGTDAINTSKLEQLIAPAAAMPGFSKQETVESTGVGWPDPILQFLRDQTTLEHFLGLKEVK